jgi:Pentapeptide repeats (8 copies)
MKLFYGILIPSSDVLLLQSPKVSYLLIDMKQLSDLKNNLCKVVLIILVPLVSFGLITLWQSQDNNLALLQGEINNFRSEVQQMEFSDKQLQLKKDILVIEKDKTIIKNGTYTTLVQSIGSIALLLTAYVGYRNFKIGEQNLKVAEDNLKVTQDKQVTERFSKAIEHLGSDKIDIQLGGIYALEQIAIDSPEKYHWTMVEILSAVIREKSPQGVDILKPKKFIDPKVDIKAIAFVLSRRNVKCDPQGKFINLGFVNLTQIETDSGGNFDNCNLVYSNLTGAKLSGIKLRRAILTGSILVNTKLQGADLSGANLSGKHLPGSYVTISENGANLSHADLTEANLTKANLSFTDLTRTNFSRANLSDTDLTGANLSQIILDGAIVTNTRFENNEGMTEELRADLEHRGAVFLP